MQSQTILIVPSWVMQAAHFVQHNWTVVAGVVATAIFASLAVEVLKRRYNAKQEEVMAKKAVAWLLVVFSTLFSWLAYAIFFAQGHADWLKTLPVVGSHSAEALGLAYTLYALRLSKWYKSFAAWASKWTGKHAVMPTVNPVVPETPVPAETPGTFA